MARLRGQHLFNTALIGAVFVVALDRLGKMLAFAIWREHPRIIINHLLAFVFSPNPNISFSLNTRIDPLYIVFPLVIAVAYFCWRAKQQDRPKEAAALCLIFFGAASNLFDRLFYGFVIDYADLRYFTVFNLADCLIALGLIWMSISLLFNNSKPRT